MAYPTAAYLRCAECTKAIAQLAYSMAILTLPAGRIPARLSLRQRIGAA
jgi:hypothetical protein